MSNTNILSTAENTINATLSAMAQGAQNLSLSNVYGSKESTSLFQTTLGGVSLGSAVQLNNVQGSLIDGPTDYCLAVSGEGGVVVQTHTGQLGVSRTVFSQGVNAQNVYVVGDSSKSDAPIVMGWRVDENGARLNAANNNALGNPGDLTQLVPVDLTAFKTFSEKSTSVTLVNILDSRKAPNNTATADPANDVQQTVSVYDTIGGKHQLGITWRKILDTTSGAANNNAGPDANSLSFNDGTTTHTNCDVWKAIITCDGAPATYGGGTAFDFTNTPRMYMKNGKIVGFAQSASNAALGTTSFPSIQIPLTIATDNITLNPGLTVGNVGGTSNITEAATSTQLSGSANGSALVKLQGWQVDGNGYVNLLYPTTTRPAYQLAVGNFPSINNVISANGIWFPNVASGAMTLSTSGQGVGSISPRTLEESTAQPTNILLKTMPLSQVVAASAKFIETKLKNDELIMGAFR